MSLKAYMVIFTVYAISLFMWNSQYLPDFIMDDPILTLITFLAMNIGLIWGFRYYK
jgi:hypothetical protein